MKKWETIFVVLTAVGLSASVVAWSADTDRFYFAYLTAYMFTLTLVLGMLFFVMLHHVTDAGWSTVVRRSAEQCLACMPVLVVLFGPALAGMGVLFHLNLPFFLVRAGIYFAVWLLLVGIFRGKSLQQDQTGDAQLSLSMRRWSGPGFLLYGATVTAAAIDWMMRLEYPWFSTIYGVYVWSGATVGALALLTVIVLRLKDGPLKGLVASDHLHDLGKLIFAFSVFWAYIAFSQYFLIWYANIPEETKWFLRRWQGGWKLLSILVPAWQFALPFVVLMSARAKRDPAVLGTASILLVVAHYLDVYWLVMPAMQTPTRQWSITGIWIDAAALLAVGGICGLVILRAMSKGAPYPLKDPRLHEAAVER